MSEHLIAALENVKTKNLKRCRCGVRHDSIVCPGCRGLFKHPRVHSSFAIEAVSLAIINQNINHKEWENETRNDND